MPERNDTSYSAWNPGVESEIPAPYRELETIYNSEHVYTRLDEIKQLVAETGLDALELVSFRPQRLVLHELIVRVNADIVVLEGEAEEDLGINFRTITNKIFERYIKPALPNIEQDYEALCAAIETITQGEIDSALARLQPPPLPEPTLWQRLMGIKPKSPVIQPSREEREFALIDDCLQRAQASDDETLSAVLRSLHSVLGAISRTRGFIGNDPQYLGHVCVLHATNHLASRHIGGSVGKLVDNAIKAENLALIPDAQKPVLISLKGASASGKSSLRPMLRQMLTELGIEEHGYGTISPDIWRKLLLDYDALGDSYKYAGRFTSHEVGVIDAKLDRYIRAKAKKRRSIPHLVVDRFRFDSFASEKISRVLHNTYVRYIDTMYMYFLVTPPEATVERGWQRGLERGRYKSVEDYLGHCVEAYSGMPKLLFKWLANDRPRFFFEFLDNRVARGQYPTLIARGSQGTMRIFDVEPLIDIERFKRINVAATTAEQVPARAEELSPDKNLGFLRQCIQRIEHVEFVDAHSGRTYLEAVSGKFMVCDDKVLQRERQNHVLQAILAAFAPALLED
jgi:thymidylate kinase